MYPEIDYCRCNFCKVCVEVCPYEVFEIIENKVIVKNKESCIECGECIRNCDYKAIKLTE